MVIMDTYEGVSVTTIGEYAFKNHTDLKYLVIPNTVTCIGSFAFQNCRGFTDITVPDSIRQIGEGAFSGCSSLVSITLPFIGDYFGKSVNDTYQYPFGYVFGTLAYNGGVATEQRYYGSSLSTLVSTTYYIPRSLRSVTVTGRNDSVLNRTCYGAFYNCSLLTDVTLGDEFITVADYAFYGCRNLVNVDLSLNINTIGTHAFYSCSNLSSIWIGSEVTSIGENAFKACYKLAEVINRSKLNINTWSSDLTTNCYVAYYAIEVHNNPESKIVNCDDYLFYTHSSTNYLLGYVGEDTALILPESYNGESYQIHKYAFYCDNVTSAIIPDSVISISDNAFSDCSSLGRVIIGDKVTSIGENAFYMCTRLSGVTIGNSVKTIGNNAFLGCNKLLEVVNKSTLNITKGSTENGRVGYSALEIHNGESKLVIEDEYLFYTYEGVSYLVGYVGNSSSLILPDSYNGGNYEIYRNAFSNYTAIVSVYIPNSVTNIGDYAFSGCRNLAEFIVDESNPNYKSINGSLYTKDGKTLIQYASQRTETAITISSAVTHVSPYAFCSFEKLESIVFEGGVILGNYAFNGCSSLKSVTIGNGVTVIDAYVFGGCVSIDSITIGSGTITISDNAFRDCTTIANVTLGEGVTSIGNYAFYGCKRLQSIVISDSAELIGDYAFYKCTALNSVKIGNGVIGIGKYAFYGCSTLSDLTIGEGVITIGDYAFSGCSNITRLVIPNSVTTISAYSFQNCTRIEELVMGKGVTSIAKGAFNGCMSMKTFKYRGSGAQWVAITKSNGWNGNLSTPTKYNYTGE